MKRKMLKYDAEGSQRLGETLLSIGITPDSKKMFGHEVFFLNSHMFCGANEKGIFVHVGKERVESSLKNREPGLLPFEPLEGTVMQAYLLLGHPICQDQERLIGWLKQSSDYLKDLPPKPRKKKKRKTGNT